MAEYLLHIVVIVLIYLVLVVSLDLVAGHTGFLSLAHAAFYGIGAYSSALVSVRCDGQFFIGAFVGMSLAGCLSIAISLPSLRLHGDYFLLLTFGFQVLVFNLLNNWDSVTQGARGISGVPPPRVGSWTADTSWRILLICLVCAVVSYVVVEQLGKSPFGRVLHAIREDEILVQSLGKNVLVFKLSVFAVSSALAALAGSLYAQYIGYVNPATFTVMDSISILSMVIVGGAGSRWGPLVGTAILLSLPELLRIVGLTTAAMANVRQMLYGALLVAMMIYRPQGLLGEAPFEAE